jgi:hypothetical protein
MRKRAERSEMREQAHQSQWGMEIDRLRLRLQALEPLAARANHDPTVLLRQQLRVAEQRAAQLEEQLLEVLGRSQSESSDRDAAESSTTKRHTSGL